jgi:hypothetical protein
MITNLQCNYGVLQSNVESFRESIKQFTMSDDSGQLLGPEVMVAQHREKTTLYAFGYRDIYDKKIEQKLLRFFIYGFPNVDYLFNTWVCSPKVGQVMELKQSFNKNVCRNDNHMMIVEGLPAEHVNALTYAQRTAEWFLFRGFHLTATMVS